MASYWRERQPRTILAAPGVGMIHGSYGADAVLLADRIADGRAFRGERVVRIPRRAVRDQHRRWLLAHSRLGEALS